MKIVIFRLDVGPESFYACSPMKRGELAWLLSGGQLAGSFFFSRRELISRVREKFRHVRHLRIVDKTT